jgi:hypothetical protein
VNRRPDRGERMQDMQISPEMLVLMRTELWDKDVRLVENIFDGQGRASRMKSVCYRNNVASQKGEVSLISRQHPVRR